MNKIIDEIVKIDELSLQIKNELQRSLYVNLCYTKASINKMMLDENISFENITYEYLLQKINQYNSFNL
jgi:hypothetical protein